MDTHAFRQATKKEQLHCSTRGVGFEPCGFSPVGPGPQRSCSRFAMLGCIAAKTHHW